MDDVAIEKIKEFEEKFAEYADRNAKKFLTQVRENKMWEESGEAELKKAIQDFKTSWPAQKK